MALTVTTGKTFAAGETVTPTKLNLLGVPAIALVAGKFAGRKTASGDGALEEMTPAEARAEMGIATSLLNSNLAASIGITLAGALGGDVIFNAANAPTVQLTAGTWLLIGSVAARTSDVADAMWAQFWNATDAAAFGGGAAVNEDGASLTRQSLHVVGIVTVAANKDIYFKVFRAGASTLDIGMAAPNGPAGFIQAIKLYS